MITLRNLLIALALLWAIPADAANRFAVCTVTCNWSSTGMWSATTGGVTGQTVPGTSDVATLDGATCVGGVTCTITIDQDVSVQVLTWGACTAATTGCIVDNSTNHNVTVSSASGFSGSGTGTRTWTGGSGTYTVTATTTGTPWAMNVVTNLSNPTTAFSSATIAFTGNSTGVLTFQGGGLTYGTITFAGMSNKGGISIGGANTISSLTVTGPNTVVWPAVTNTITTLAFNGTIANPIGILDVSNTRTTAVISVASGTPTLAGVAVRGMTFQGGATWSATNCYDLGLNTGLTCAAPTSGGGKIIGG